MRVRDYLQENQADMGTSGTKTYPLDYSDPISEINLLFEATNGATSNKNNPIVMNIEKIEIVDGGEVLWDLPGEIAFAYAAHIQNYMPHRWGSGAPSGSPWVNVPVRFGRYTLDPVFAFNPNAHKNPQLRVTFDEASINTAGATGFVSDSFNISITVRLMEDVPSPAAFLSARTVEQYTSVASGDQKTDMPTDRVMRSIFVRPWETAVHPSSTVSRYKLSADGGKFVPFDLYYRNLRDRMASYFRPLRMAQYTIADDSEYHQSWIGDCYHYTLRSANEGVIAASPGHSGGRVLLYLTSHAGAAQTNQTPFFAVEGLPVFQTYIYPFGRLNDPDSWYDARQNNKLDLYLTNANAGGEISVCCEQVYSY
jgi:hypothetical protein